MSEMGEWRSPFPPISAAVKYIKGLLDEDPDTTQRVQEAFQRQNAAFSDALEQFIADHPRIEEDYQETANKIAERFFPEVVNSIELYKTAAKEAGKDVEINLQVLVGYLTGKPQATIQWQKFAEQEQSDILAIRQKGPKRSKTLERWNLLLATIGGESQVIQDAKEQEKKVKASAFEGYLDTAELQLSGDWQTQDEGVTGASRLRVAVTAFRQDVANAGWNITKNTTENFYNAVSAFTPGVVLLDEYDRAEQAEEHYDIQALQAIGHGTSHGERIRSYIKSKVAPKAHRAGLDANNDAVISFVRAVATEWCSAAESSNTGGNPSAVANFSRGDMISAVRDLPDESRTAGLDLDARIANVRAQLSREIDDKKIKLLKDTLSNLLQKRENT